MRLFTFLALALAAPAWSIEVRVASATVPPGGSIQLQLAPTNPQPILGSGNALEFSSSDFTSVDGIALFSPAGDAAGTAIVTARGVMIRAVSPQGSFGTGSYPMLTAVARTNPAARIGSKSTVTINPGLSFWQDLFGQNYPATTKPGTITFGGSAWISNIVPGGGPLPAGHSVKILGGGFSPGTAVAIDGVTIASKRFVNPNEIEVTLGEAADLTSARVLLKNPDNFLVTYYSYLRAAALGASARPLIASTRPIFQNLYKSGAYLAPAASGVTALAMQNANTRSVDVTLDLVDASGISQAQVVVTLPSGFRWTRELSEIFGGAAIPAGGGVKASSSAAIQFLGVNADEAAGTAVPMIPLASQPVTNMLSANPASLTFDYAIGGANPPPQGIAVTSILGAINYSSAVTPVASWLGVTSGAGSTPGSISVSVTPGSLAPGAYKGSIAIAGGGLSVAIPVTFNITTAPVLSLSSQALVFSGFGSQTVNVTSAGGSAAFTAAKSGPWIVLPVISGTTPQALSIDVNPAGLAPAIYTGQVTITSGTQILTINLTLNLSNPCSYTLSSTAASAPASGGGGRIDVATAAGCVWPASSGSPWIKVTPASTTGPGPVKYTVAANTGGSGRTGALVVAGQTFTVTQAGTGCIFTVNPAGLTFTAAGGTQSVAVTVPAGCGYLATASANWLSFPGGPAGTGSGALSIAAQPWRGRAARTGAITVGGQAVPVIQQPALAARLFNDVPPDHQYADWIALLKENGVTAGCQAESYCPDAVLTRGEMAAFVVQAGMGGDTFEFDAQPVFGDVAAAHPYFKYIQKMAELGMSDGSEYYPDSPVSRAEMTATLARATAGQTFPFTDAPFFQDVPAGSPYYPYIQKLKEMGIAEGCSADAFCPGDPATRGQMAVFVIRAFFTL